MSAWQGSFAWRRKGGHIFYRGGHVEHHFNQNKILEPEVFGVHNTSLLATSALNMPPRSQNKYSVILPTYNERQNLPVLVQLLYDVFSRKYDSLCLFAGLD